MARAVFVALALSACGDDGAATPPDATTSDAPPVATICQGVGADVHVETDDIGNGVGEPTNKTLTAEAPIRICGRIEQREAGMELDGDTYFFTLPVASRVRIDISAPGADAAEALFALLFGEATASEEGRRATGSVHGGRITMVAPNCADNVPECAAQTLAPGEYRLNIAPFSFTNTQPTMPFEYRVTITIFDADAACAMPATVTYREMRDTAPAHDQNDVMLLGTQEGSPTPNTADAPEATGLALTAGIQARLAGVAGLRADALKDRDTYAITTGPTTTALDIRVAWAGDTDDLDLDVYEGVGIENLAARGWSVANPEYFATAVKPSTEYLLFVRRYGSGTAELPYDIAVCASATP